MALSLTRPFSHPEHIDELFSHNDELFSHNEPSKDASEGQEDLLLNPVELPPKKKGTLGSFKTKLNLNLE